MPQQRRVKRTLVIMSANLCFCAFVERDLTNWQGCSLSLLVRLCHPNVDSIKRRLFSSWLTKKRLISRSQTNLRSDYKSLNCLLHWTVRDNEARDWLNLPASFHVHKSLFVESNGGTSNASFLKRRLCNFFAVNFINNRSLNASNKTRNFFCSFSLRWESFDVLLKWICLWWSCGVVRQSCWKWFAFDTINQRNCFPLRSIHQYRLEAKRSK